MKILLVDVNCKNSSTGNIVYDLYTEFNKRGHEAAICYGRGPLVKEKNILKISSAFEVYLHAFLTRITGLTDCYSFFSTMKLIRFIKRFKPDVVHLHDIFGYFLNHTMLFKFLKARNIKVIWTIHSENPYTGKCGHAYECNKWKTECHRCPQKKEWPESWFFDFTSYMFNKKKKIMKDFNNISIVTPSKWLANRARQSFLKDKDIRVIHNGIDLSSFQIYDTEELKNSLNIENKEKVLLHVTSFDLLNDQKGGKYVIDLARNLEDRNIKVVVVCKETSIENMPRNFIQVGPIYNKELLAKYYSMADLFVITSKRENFPTVCIEALSCGTPVVGFEGGGTAETAPDKYGFFVKYGDIDKLSKIILMYFSGKLILKNQIDCEKYAKNNYSKDAMCSKYIDLIDGR